MSEDTIKVQGYPEFLTWLNENPINRAERRRIQRKGRKIMRETDTPTPDPEPAPDPDTEPAPDEPDGE